MRAALSLLSVCLLASTQAGSEPVHGRMQLQDVVSLDKSQSLAAQLGERTRNDVLGDLRLDWSPRLGSWSFDTAYVASFDAGDSPTLTEALDALRLLPRPPPGSWFDLTDQLADGRHFTAVQRIDRLALGFASGPWVARAGRQALTWGAGLVFRPMDLLDPFAPDATDTEYKTGTDMIYGQYLFGDGSDIQAVIVPRPAQPGGRLTANASSFALFAHGSRASLQTTALLARDRGDAVAGLGFGGALGGASWNAEVVPTFLRTGGTRVSALANFSSAGKLAGRDISYFAEYFHNGFGLSGRDYSLADLSGALLDRLQRGQVFNTGRDYLAAGVQLRWTPLLEVSPTIIANLDDCSLYLLGEAKWSLNDNLNLIAGAQLPIGPAGTEFGGIPVLSSASTTLVEPARFYIQLRQYF